MTKEMLAFKPSDNCIHGLKDCCLFAKFRNSLVPQMGVQHRAKHGFDPEFEVFVRESEAANISAWQEQVLQRLFEQNEISAAVKQGMEEYVKEWKNHYEGFESNLDEIQRDGILPHMTLQKIVVDGTRREVILALLTDSIESLQDDGIAISLQDGRWVFNLWKYLDDFVSEVRLEEMTRRLARVPFTIGGEAECGTDVEFIYGVWVFDEIGTRKRLERIGDSEEEIRPYLDALQGFSYSFGRTHCVMTNSVNKFNFECIQYERAGNRIALKFRYSNFPEIHQLDLLYENSLLVDVAQRVVLRRGQST